MRISCRRINRNRFKAEDFQSARLTRASPSPCFRTSIIHSCSVLCFSALCFLGFYNCGNATSRFCSSDGWWVERWGRRGCQQGRRVNKKKSKERSRTAVEQAPSIPVFELTQKKKNSPGLRRFFLVSAPEFWPQPTTLALMKAGLSGTPTPAVSRLIARILWKSLACSLSRSSRDYTSPWDDITYPALFWPRS